MCYNELTQNNILQEIFTNGINYNSYISFVNFNTEAYSKKIFRKGQVFNFALTDEYSTPLNLNGVNMVFTIMLYQSNNFEHLVEKYIRYKTNKNTNETDDEIEEF